VHSKLSQDVFTRALVNDSMPFISVIEINKIKMKQDENKNKKYMMTPNYNVAVEPLVSYSSNTGGFMDIICVIYWNGFIINSSYSYFYAVQECETRDVI
jgi:hypothetical protein